MRGGWRCCKNNKDRITWKKVSGLNFLKSVVEVAMYLKWNAAGDYSPNGKKINGMHYASL